MRELNKGGEDTELFERFVCYERENGHVSPGRRQQNVTNQPQVRNAMLCDLGSSGLWPAAVKPQHPGERRPFFGSWTLELNPQVAIEPTRESAWCAIFRVICRSLLP